MSDRDLADVRRLWNALAEDWRIQVGDAGDANRRLNSDPVLWAFVGEVAGQAVGRQQNAPLLRGVQAAKE